jgi:hypothetical protein
MRSESCWGILERVTADGFPLGISKLEMKSVVTSWAVMKKLESPGKFHQALNLY